ncbi:MAG: AAA family ATPase [Deltaproteobacteria bacterium]|nr:AAA family ATPase [Deltaproteobacteria bacterium]MBI3391297.1 AAA family ATPase [Deltaproteobacteria bacterium]
MFCPKCNARCNDEVLACAECGAALGPVCLACGAQNLPGSLFCRMCGRPLSELSTDRPSRSPAAYTPRHLTEKILTSRAALEGERKQVTVLFADVKGSQALAQSVGPEAWHETLDRFFEILSAGVHRFEGTINQYTGDGIMALFGAPIAHEDHAQRACFAALHLKKGIAAFHADLRRTRGIDFAVRTGLNSGEVVVGRIGDDLRMDYTAQGHTVGLASRMESLAEPGKIYLTRGTAALVSGFFQLKDLGKFSVKGERRSLRVYELEAVGAARTRFDQSTARGLSPFVGREAEMARLEASLADALAGNGCAVGVVSEAGCGKSRLFWEFAAQCRARDILVLQARGVPHGRASPFLPIVELLRGYFDVRERDDDAAVREKVTGQLILLGEPLREALPLVFELLRVSEADHLAQRIDPEARRRQILRLLTDLVRVRSAQEPIVVVGEDLQWFDRGSEAVLDQLVAELPGGRTLIVVNYRPDHRPPWHGRTQFREIPLEALAPEATLQLVGDLLGNHRSVRSLIQRIAERSGGNPFFVEEAIRSLKAGGALTGRAGSYRAEHRVEEIEIPATVQAVLDARIDALKEREKVVLQTAAVIGKEFPLAVLQRIVPYSKAELRVALKTLSDTQLLSPPNRSGEVLYAFRHSPTQEAAYRTQLIARRQQIHAEVARIIEELHPGVDEQAALIAHHRESAGDERAAVDWYVRAARWLGSEDPAEAYRYWQKVRALLTRDNGSANALPLRVLALIQMLNLSWRLGVSEEEVRVLFEEVRDLAQQSESRDALVTAYLAYAVVRGMAGHLNESLENVREATHLAEDSGNADLKRGLKMALAYFGAAAGRLRESLATTEAALSQEGGDSTRGAELSGIDPFVFLTGLRGHLLGQMGKLAEARAALDAALELSAERVDSEVRGWIHGWIVVLARATGETADALGHARRGLDIAEKTGSFFSQVIAFANLGRALAFRGEWQEAVGAFEKSLDIARARKIGCDVEAGIVADLAEVNSSIGNHQAALALAREAIDLAQRRGVKVEECRAHLVNARVILRAEGAGKQRAVRKALEAAMAIARATEARVYEPFIHLELAEVARLAGDDAARASELRISSELFAEIGATGHLAAAAGNTDIEL